jgi:hypothetical protein
MQLFGIPYAHYSMQPGVVLSRVYNWMFKGKPQSDWYTWLALYTYSILAEKFTWEPYKILIKQVSR